MNFGSGAASKPSGAAAAAADHPARVVPTRDRSGIGGDGSVCVPVFHGLARGADRVSVMSAVTADRPRERLLRLGASALSDRELLALLIGTGSSGRTAREVAEALWATAGPGGLSTLARTSLDALTGLPGLGEALGARLVAAFELGRRAARQEGGGVARIGGPADVAARMMPVLADLDQEEFHVVLLNRQHHPIRTIQVTRGILDASLIHPREVFRRAVEAGAAAVIVVHNHPSGDPSPSAEDRAVTRQLAEAGRVLGIPLLDHVIVARGGWRALSREEGSGLG